jgi:hypothetical protein
MCTFFLVVAFRDARFLSGLYGRFSYIVIARKPSLHSRKQHEQLLRGLSVQTRQRYAHLL